MTKTSVFVVDDDPSIRRSLERLLRAAGYAVETFASSREFIEHADIGAACCVVLDIRMPGPSGLDVLRLLEAGDHHVPVIFITGHADVPSAQQDILARAVTVLTKPFDGEALLSVVSRARQLGLVWNHGH